jgi:hypothetical protein
MTRTAIVAGTGFEGRDKIIRKHCRAGVPVFLRRDPSNKHDPNAVAVLLDVPRVGGLFGSTRKQIGFIKAHTAKSLSKRLDQGEEIKGSVKSLYAPEGRDFPRVTVELDY